MIGSMLIMGGLGRPRPGVADARPFGLLAVTVGLSGIAMGLFMPSSNNAALDLLPDRVG